MGQMEDELRSFVRLYYFINLETEKAGQPFALCDFHKTTYKEPDGVLMQELGISTSPGCFKCAEDGEGGEKASGAE
jgi:hypothetical protein